MTFATACLQNGIIIFRLVQYVYIIIYGIIIERENQAALPSVTILYYETLQRDSAVV